MISTKVEHITNLLSTGGSNHLSGCGSSHVYVRVCVEEKKENSTLPLVFRSNVSFDFDGANIYSPGLYDSLLLP